MAYGIIKVDTIIFDQGGADQNVTVSGIYRAITSGVTVSGTISGAVLVGTTTVSGTTVTGTTANFVSGVFTTQISGATVIAPTGTFTSLTGTTTTGTTSSFTSGVFTTLSGATATFTSGIIASGTAAAPSLAILGDPNTGVYSPGADQLAVATNGTQRLTVDTAATTSTLPVVHPLGAVGTPSITFTGDLNTGIYSPAADTLALVTAGNNTLHITSGGLVGIGTSSPNYQLHVTTDFAVGASGFNQQLTFGNDTIQSLLLGTGYTALKLNPLGGNVGIGTTSPSAILDVKVASDAKLLVQDGNTTGNVKFNAVNNAVSANVNLEISASNTQFFNGGSERARIDSSGNVGIGTASPLTKLEVRSGVITAGSVDAPNGAEILRGYYGSSGALVVIGSEYSSGGPVIGYAVKPSTSASDAFLSSASGALTRGAYTIAGNIHKWYIGGSQTVAENSPVSTSEVMRIDTSGRVGIGTTSPARVLDIAGTYANFGINGTSNSYIDYLINGVGIGIIGDANWLFSGGSTSNLGIRATNNLLFGIGAAERARIDSSGRLLVGTSSDSGGALLQVNDDRIRVGTAKTPATSGATGTTGEIAWDANYIYVCTATNTWKRSAIATW